MNGNWGSWTEWGSCTLSCGGGTRIRTRRCDSPLPSDNGRYCSGSDRQVDYCNSDDCPGIHTHSALPSQLTRSIMNMSRSRMWLMVCVCLWSVHGNWALWSSWGDCTVSCGSGQRRRFRTCTNPRPEFNGRDCLGAGQQTQHCNTHSCAGQSGCVTSTPATAGIGKP